MENVVRTICPYCGVGCGLAVKVRHGRIVEVKGDKAHPSTLGGICVKGAQVGEIVATPNRLVTAHIRGDRAGPFQPTTLDQALEHAAGEFRDIIQTYGSDAVAFYISGQLTTEAQYVFNKLAKGFIGTNNVDANSRLCMASAASAYKLALGSDGPPTCYDDIEHAECFLIVGANMAECHPVLWQRVKRRLSRKRVRVIVVDPRRTPTAEGAHLHLAIKPGTDIALLNSLLHVMITQGWINERFVRAHTENWEAVREAAEAWPPGRAARECGVTEEEIHRAAFWFGQSAEALSLWTMGVNQSTSGVAKNLAIINLHLATGKIGRPGSGPFSLTGQPNAMGGREVGYLAGQLPGYRDVTNARHREEIAQLWNVPVERIQPQPGLDAIRMFEALEDGRVKAIWIAGTNPLATMPNTQRVRRALERARLVVVQDCYHPTETSSLAHVLLPAAMSLEVEGTMTNSERCIGLLQPCLPPPGEARPDWEIASRFAVRLGFTEAFSYSSASDVFEEHKRCCADVYSLQMNGITYDRLKHHALQWPCPTPMSRGVARRYRNKTFPTATGRARFHPVDCLPPGEALSPEFPLVLNTGRVAGHWHTRTKTGHVAKLNKLNPAPFLAAHPKDAEALGLAEGDPVRLTSSRGSTRTTLKFDAGLRRGTLFMPFHWGQSHDVEGCVNAVTNGANDPISREPELKFSAVCLDKCPVDQPAKNMNQIPYIPETAPFTAEQRAWLNGFLAGLMSQTPAAQVAPGQTNGASPAGGEPLLVLFGSQTGTAEGLAKKMAKEALQRGFLPRVLPLNDCEPATLAQATKTVIISSTWGDGDPPDNAVKFWSWLNAETAPRLEKLQFAVLGLGDKNYSDFCGASKKFDVRMETLGAKRLVDRGECDVDYEAPAAVWVDGLWKKLDRSVVSSQSSVAATNVRQTSATDYKLLTTDHSIYGKSNPFPARLLKNVLLNKAGSAKEVRHYELSLQDSGLNYEAGDALGVVPVNCPELVNHLLALLNCKGDETVNVSEPGIPLREAFARHFDITKPSTELLAAIAKAVPGGELAPLLVPERTAELKKWLWGRDVMDVLQLLPLPMPFTELLPLLRKLAPRLYSISSSPKAHPGEVHITASAVRYERFGRGRKGVASTFLADRTVVNERIKVYVQPSHGFKLPVGGDTPIIMVGPGTGIAPFRAFLEERQATGAQGKNWLFFGDQRRASDFLYEEQLTTWHMDGLLSRLDLAFSRDQAEKVYVQHRMREHAADIWSWLEAGAHFYVCGDAARMAKDVDAALHAIIEQAGGTNADEAKGYVEKLRAERRYQRDVY
jgi:sulfite reductase (NADPH) flavoprotein alpha-component